MASVVKIRRSSVQGKAPTTEQLQLGELALNTRDGKLFSSTGGRVFEVGANTSVSRIGTLTVGNTTPFTLPTSDGVSGQVLKTNGAGSVFWSNTSSSASSGVSENSFREFNFSANTGQTIFSGFDNSNNALAYDSTKIVLFLNGVRLSKGTDYTANNGTTIVLDDPLSNNDVIDVHTYTNVDNELYRSENTYSANALYTQSIDSWSTTTYRSAKYIVQIEDVVNNAFEVREVLLVHNGSSAYFSEMGAVNTNGARVAYIGTQVVSNQVHLLVTPTTGNSIDVNLVRISLD